MKVPPKVRIFWWRVLHNYMPTKEELKRRHISKEGHCETCGKDSESLYHVVFECTYAHRFWDAVKEITGVKMPNLHPLTWARDIMAHQNIRSEETSVLVCDAWSLWSGRNARHHGSRNWEPEAAVRHVSKMLEEMLSLEIERRLVTSKPRERWKPPDPGWVKVNTDGAFYSEPGNGASGMIIRNDMGQVLAVEGRWIPHLGSALMAEAIAARDGLLLAVANGYNKVALEVDNLSLAKALQSGDEDRSEIAGVKQEVTELGRSLLLSVFLL